jgi:hypothetical protein
MQLGGGGGGAGVAGAGALGQFGGGNGGLKSGHPTNAGGATGTAGAANTGGGGGGSTYASDGTWPVGGAGGSGIFIISYPLFTTTASYTTKIVNGVQYYKFTTSGSITTSVAVVMDYFAIGGGGAGGTPNGAGGGGAGGLVRGFMPLNASTTYSLVIGTGGVSGANGDNPVTTGLPTTFNGIVALGGGGGGRFDGGPGQNGGCGGGPGGIGSQGFNAGVNGGGGLGGAGNGTIGGTGIMINGEPYGGGGAGFGGTASFGGGGSGGLPGAANTGAGGGGWSGTGKAGGAGGTGVFICSFFTPTSIAGCNLWLDANDPKNDGTQYTDGAVMTKWNNKSGSGGWANAIGSPLFTRMAMNGRPAITMGTGRYAQFNTTDTGTSLSAFAVATTEQSSITTPSQLMSVYKSGDPNDYTSLTSMALMYRDAYGGNNGLEMKSYRTAPVSNGVLTGLATPFLCTTMVNSLGVSGYLNGLLASTASAGLVGAFGYDRIIVGAGYPTTSPGGWWLGAVSEVITYTTTLSSYNRLRVETYLANKYSISYVFTRTATLTSVISTSMQTLTMTGIAPTGISGWTHRTCTMNSAAMSGARTDAVIAPSATAGVYYSGVYDQTLWKQVRFVISVDTTAGTTLYKVNATNSGYTSAISSWSATAAGNDTIWNARAATFAVTTGLSGYSIESFTMNTA